MHIPENSASAAIRRNPWFRPAGWLVSSCKAARSKSHKVSHQLEKPAVQDILPRMSRHSLKSLLVFCLLEKLSADPISFPNIFSSKFVKEHKTINEGMEHVDYLLNVSPILNVPHSCALPKTYMDFCLILPCSNKCTLPSNSEHIKDKNGKTPSV